MNNPEYPQSLDSTIMSLLEGRPSEKAVLEALRLFNESDEPLEEGTINELRTWLSAWGINDVPREQVQAESAAATVQRTAVPGNRSALFKEFNRLEEELQNQERPKNITVETLPMALSFYTLRLAKIQRAVDVLDEIIASYSGLEAWLQREQYRFRVIAMGEKWAKRVRSDLDPTTLEPLRQEQENYRDTRIAYLELLEIETSYIDELASLYSDFERLQADFRAKKAALDAENLSETTAHIAERLTSQLAPDDGFDN